MAQPFYITTPIYYVNDVPHIGHAYTSIACDVLARFHRLDGREVLFLTGTDEHGQKVAKSAQEAGQNPQSFCDQVSLRFRELIKAMNCSADDFIRTTESRHILACQALWKRLEDEGWIYQHDYEGWYSVRDEAFYQPDEVVSTPTGQKVAISGAQVEWLKEPSFFFRMSKMQKPLIDFYKKNPHFVLPETRMNEVLSFVEGGLKDLSISRTSFSWGIPVPSHAPHIMYVWIDALINYISALGYPNITSANYKKFWPGTHVIGKDILRFHAVYWPAFLMAAGLEPPLRIFAHGWWTNEGVKISKSLGNVIDPFALVNEFGLDPVRYFLMRDVPFGNDGDFSRHSLIHRFNSDLANDLGNLAQRTLTQIANNCSGEIPSNQNLLNHDKFLLETIEESLEKIRAFLNDQVVHRYLEVMWSLISSVNGYISTEQPWVLKKTNPTRMMSVLYTTSEALRRIALLLQPVMPESAGKLLDQLSVPQDMRNFHFIGSRGALNAGAKLPTPKVLFPRLQTKG